MARPPKTLLGISFPYLLKEWDFKNNKIDPYKTGSYSHKKVWWVCPDCGFSYQKEIYKKTTTNKKCSRCNSVALYKPELLKDWDYNKNKVLPDRVQRGSDKKVWWVCHKCGYSWKSSPDKRVNANRGCPYCAGKVITKETCLKLTNPEIVKEWDYNKNNSLTPDKITSGSGKIVNWVCRTCGNGWKAAVFNRVKGHGCPFCSGLAASLDNNITVTHPYLMKELHPFKNKGILLENLLSKSNKSLWWKCTVCSYEWKAYVYNRTKGHNCPSCAGQVANENNNLLKLFPEVASEWDYHKNKKGPDKYTARTRKKVWWKCNKCKYKWYTSISERTRTDRSSGFCPGCYNNSVSNISQEWLDSLNVPTVYGVYREVFIQCGQKKFKVDGYDLETNTIYEFLGDFWHGNPDIYPPEGINPVNKQTYAALYISWLDKLNELKKYGYKIIYIWESEFLKNKQKKEGK